MGRQRRRVVRDVAIALPPVVEIVLVVAGSIVSVGAVGESAESWARSRGRCTPCS
ncbi:hypothetical protein [Curtobacterium flaccumfaciens]|uniref:hypothetical protein n=1 Tax=Curtobacterium flaccumfaciens TaxID=2035 RepID=UPI0037BE5F40